MQTNPLSRRTFLAASASTSATLALAAAPALAAEPAPAVPAFKGRIRKAMIVGLPTEANLKPLKEAGFHGVESNAADATEADAAKARALAESMGLRVHSVLRGWMEFNSDDPAKVESSLEKVRRSLRAAAAYGADAVLVVPCRVGGGGMAIPKPWEFDIALDEKTGHVTRVVAGDNAPYAAYIDAQNKATDRSRAAVEKLVGLAEQLKVVIALENVWNNLWVKPAIFAHFVKSFATPWVSSYFDIGNHVRYAPPQDWIKALGPGRIAKVHIKDFKLNDNGQDGKFVHPRDGSVDWPLVRRTLDEVGYDGWATIEDGGLSLAEFSRRLDLIIEGK